MSEDSSSSSSSTIEFKEIEQSTMFTGSGLDPRRRIRLRQRRRAQKFARKARSSKKDSKSDSSESPADLVLKGDQVFGESQKIRAVGLMFPGVLASQGIEAMQNLLVQEIGEEKGKDDHWSPTLLKYYRQALAKRMAGPMSREAFTLSTIGDQLLKGSVPGALDCLVQRIKSLEAQASGLGWSAAQRLELLPPDGATLSSRQELSIAVAEQRAEVKAHQTPTWRDWGKGKGGKGESNKGKGKKGKEKPKKE